MSTSSSNITLHNLELNEDTLASLFLLSPSSASKEQSMIKVSSALCSSVSISIPWTSITTSPIVITFDSLEIIIDILETPTGSPTHQASTLASLTSSNDEEKSYGFIDKIIDGICFSLNTLHIELRSSKFTATLDLSFLRANPSPPNFKLVPGKKQDLRLTRIKSSPFILLFKKISWQTLKLEAKAVVPDEEAQNGMSSVIRLISSGGCTNLTVKKSLLNREVVCAKCSLVLDDVLWLMSATSSQSRSAMALTEFISSFIVSQSASTVNKSSTGTADDSAKGLGKSPAKASQVKMDTTSQLYKIFTQFDPIESSVEFNLRTFQLQFIDDMSIGNTSEPVFHSYFPPLKSGSAFLIAATAIRITIYPEYNPDRLMSQMNLLTGGTGVNKKAPKKKLVDTTSIFSRQEDALNVLITVKTLELHCVGLNDTRLKTNKSSDFETRNKCIFQAPASTSAFPDDVPAVEICYNHYYENEPKRKKEINYQPPLVPRTDSVQLKVGPSRIYFDPPTLLWLHSFLVPLTTVHLKSTFAIAAQDFSGQNKSVDDSFTQVNLELVHPVVVLDEKSPFDLFPSPFLSDEVKEKVISTSKSSEHTPAEIEITAARLELERINTTEADNKWFLKSGPIWADYIELTGLKDPLDTKKMIETRTELVEPFQVRGSIMMFDETQISMDEIRIYLEVVLKESSNLCARVRCDQIANFLRIINKLDTFTDFIAQDKLLMKSFFPSMPDSLLTMKIKVPNLQLVLVKPKNCSDASDATEVNSTNNNQLNDCADDLLINSMTNVSIAQRPNSANSDTMHKSFSAPEDVTKEVTNVSALSLETTSINESGFTLDPLLLDQKRSGSNCSLRSDIDLTNVDSKYEDDDQYILNVMNVPSSMSSSPSLQSIPVDTASLNSYKIIDDASLLSTDDIEEAEDVTAMMDEPVKTPLNQIIYEEIIKVFITDLTVEKTSNGLHGVTEIKSTKPISLFHPATLKVNDECDQKNTQNVLVVRSEIKWTNENGKQELTSILLEDQTELKIDKMTLETLSDNIVIPPDAIPPNVSPMAVIISNLKVQMLDDSSPATPPLTLVFESLNIERSSDNRVTFVPSIGVSTVPLSYIYTKHAKMFGINPAVSGLSDTLILNETDDDLHQETSRRLQAELQKNAELTRKIELLQKELDIVKSQKHG